MVECPLTAWLVYMLTMHTSGFAGPWLQEFTDLRDKINTLKLEFSMIQEVIAELDARIPQTGRNYPIPKISERALARMEREAALAGATLKRKKPKTEQKQQFCATGLYSEDLCTLKRWVSSLQFGVILMPFLVAGCYPPSCPMF